MVKHEVEMIVGSEAVKKILEFLGVERRAVLDSKPELAEAVEELDRAFRVAKPIESSLYIRPT